MGIMGGFYAFIRKARGGRRRGVGRGQGRRGECVCAAWRRVGGGLSVGSPKPGVTYRALPPRLIIVQGPTQGGVKALPSLCMKSTTHSLHAYFALSPYSRLQRRDRGEGSSKGRRCPLHWGHGSAGGHSGRAPNCAQFGRGGSRSSFTCNNA